LKSINIFASLMLVLFAGTGMLITFSSFYTNPEPTGTLKKRIAEDSTLFPQNYKIISPKIEGKYFFCGEEVPVKNIDVKERLERELIVNTYWHSLTLLSLKRAHRWFPVIEPILKKHNVPDDFKYLALVESMLTNAVSPAGAVGFWQFKEDAAREYGLEINSEIDERYHIEKATEAACKYLTDSYKKYGNWTLAAASYNYGKSGIDNQIEKQKSNNYYNLVLPEETSRYIFRIVAIKEIFKNPKRFGFYFDEKNLYQPYKTYEVAVNKEVKSWADFAKAHGINYRILKLLNPWLRKHYLKNKKRKTYKIKLPVEGSIYVIPG